MLLTNVCGITGTHILPSSSFGSMSSASQSQLCGLCTVLILPCFAAQKLALQPITVRVQAWLFQIGPRNGSAYTTRTPQMEHHVLRWIGSPSEDCPSVSNVSTQSLVGLLTYRMSHGHGIHLDTSQAYWPNPRQITIRCT